MRTANIGATPRPRPDVDAPVFDNTPTGESWRDKAAPAYRNLVTVTKFREFEPPRHLLAALCDTA
jgi:hypothetical protein